MDLAERGREISPYLIQTIFKFFGRQSAILLIRLNRPGNSGDSVLWFNWGGARAPLRNPERSTCLHRNSVVAPGKGYPLLHLLYGKLVFLSVRWNPQSWNRVHLSTKIYIDVGDPRFLALTLILPGFPVDPARGQHCPLPRDQRSGRRRISEAPGVRDPERNCDLQGHPGISIFSTTASISGASP